MVVKIIDEKEFKKIMSYREIECRLYLDRYKYIKKEMKTMEKEYEKEQIETIPNSGHFPMLETPAYLVKRIESFIAEYE